MSPKNCVKNFFAATYLYIIDFFYRAESSNLGFCEWTDPVFIGGLVLYDGPGPPIVTVSHFEGCDELDGAEVFGSLCDDPWYLLRRCKVHLKTHKHVFLPQCKNKPPHTHRSALSRSVYLQPLWLVVGGSGPSISLALFVQPSVVREPGEGLDAPGAEGAGGCDLTIGHQSGLHAHGLWTTWSGWIHCEGETRQSNRGRETGEDERKDTGRQCNRQMADRTWCRTGSVKILRRHELMDHM